MDLNRFGLKKDSKLSLSAEDHAQLLELLQKLAKMTVDEQYRSNLEEKLVQDVSNIYLNSQSSQILFECLRILRNCASVEVKGVTNVLRAPVQKCLEHVVTLAQMKDDVEEENLLLPRISLQLLANFINREPETAFHIWKVLQGYFERLLSHKDGKICDYSSATMYGILRTTPVVREEILTNYGKEISNAIVNAAHGGSLFSQLSVRLFMKETKLLPKFYNIQTLDSKVRLIHQIAEFCLESCIAKENWRFLADIFKDKANLVLRTCESSILDVEPLEVTGLLEVLAKASGEIEECRRELQQFEELVTVAIDLLIAICCLGKSSSNYFSRVDDHFEAVEDHPANGLKNNLVRLLGNLCYQNVAIQDQIREAQAIPIILECCNLDARNPFIQQWSILAIRNLCEKNQANQAVIASLTCKDVVQSKFLEDLGLRVEKSSDGLKIRPTNDNE